MTMERITQSHDQMGGVSCVRGLRIPVRTVVSCLASGMSVDEVLRDYPDLEAADVYAALEYAARSVDADPTPGFPRPPPGQTIEDLVTLDESDDPATAGVIRRAAQAALDAGIEPGLRRARYIDGWSSGYMAAQRERGDG